jgi:signal transduction histidine kinase/ActR/RegA family two-component response regulator
VASGQLDDGSIRPANGNGASGNGFKKRATVNGLKHYEKKIYAPLVALWLSLSVTGVVLSSIAWRQLSNQIDIAVQQAEFNEALDQVFAAIQDAETGQRGYLITGNEAYLRPYTDSMNGFAAKFERLVDLGLNDPMVKSKLLELRGKVEVKLAEMKQSVRLMREAGFQKASEAVRSGEGLTAMEDIRQAVQAMRLVRPEILTDKDDPTRRKLRRASITSIAAGLIGVGAGLFALFLTRVAFNQEKRERALAEGKLRAEQSSEHKSAFLANMSHEIRTPMNAILGFSDLLDGELREPKQRKWLRSIRASGHSLLQLINDVLDMSKIEAGVLELHPEPTDPREICDFIRTVFTEQATRKGVKLSCAVAEDLPRALLLDRTRLRQVLVNLVGNAVKFTERGYIRVTVQSEPQEGGSSRVTLSIEVEDTGVGIPEDRVETIFKPFVQAESSRSQERQGTGLGLAIVKRLVEVMGGKVGVASVLGKGTTFHLRVPDVSVSARLPANQLDELDDDVDFNTLVPVNILVVDDNAMNRELMAGIFEESHHTLHFGVNGREAVEKTLALKPDVVLLDIRMPELGGREALAQIHKTPGFDLLPVIAVTASSMAEEEQALRRTFSGYLRKPFSRRALLDELGHFIPKAKIAAENELEHPNVPPPGDAKALMGQLGVKLHALEAGEWPLVRDSVAINESRRFARQLRDLGEDAHCAPLSLYASKLLRHAEAYDAAALEAELGRFPAVIAEIEQLSV